MNVTGVEQTKLNSEQSWRQSPQEKMQYPPGFSPLTSQNIVSQPSSSCSAPLRSSITKIAASPASPATPPERMHALVMNSSPLAPSAGDRKKGIYTPPYRRQPSDRPIDKPDHAANQEKQIQELFNPEKKAELSEEESKIFCSKIRKSAFSFARAVENIGRYQINHFMINALINKHDPLKSNWPFKKELFRQMPLAMRTSHDYNSMIKVAGMCSDFAAAREVYNDSLESDKADAYTFANYMQAAIDNHRFYDVEKIFDKALLLKMANNVVCNIYLNHCLKGKDLEGAEKAICAIEEQGIADEYSYSNFITLAGILNNFEKANAIFQKARQLGKANSYIYSNAIYVFGKLNKISETKEAFDQACSQGITNPVIYAKYIEAMGMCKGFSEVERGYTIARDRNYVRDSLISTKYIIAACSCEEFPKAYREYLHAISEGFVNREMTNEFLMGAWKCCNDEGVVKDEKAFIERWEKHPFSSYDIQEEGDKNFIDICYAYEAAKYHGTSLSRPYHTFIQAASKRAMFLDVRSAFEEAQQRGIAIAATYNSYLLALAREGNVEMLEQVYHEAVEQGKTNNMTLRILIDSLMKLDQEEKASKYFQEMDIRAEIKQYEGLEALDLQGYYAGVGYLELKRYMNNPECPKRLAIIYGQSTDEDYKLVNFKRFIFKTLGEKHPEWRCSPDPSNSRVIILESPMMRSDGERE